MPFRLLAVCVLASWALAAPAAAQLRSSYDPDSETHQEIVKLLRENRLKYGDDATILQGLLMAHSVDTDAILTTESGITGIEETDGKRFIAYRVASGVVFNDNDLDRDARLSRVWQSILARSFLTYPDFSIPADGVAIEIAYHHRPYGKVSELYREIDDVGPLERAKFYFLGADIAAFLDQKLSSQALLAKAKVSVDDQPIEFRLQEIMTVPGPSEAGIRVAPEE
jgi:hypothetical protein